MPGPIAEASDEIADRRPSYPSTTAGFDRGGRAPAGPIMTSVSRAGKRTRNSVGRWVGVRGRWTYVLAGLRSLETEGWEWATLGKALLAIAIVGTVSMSLCVAALRGRIRNG